MQRGCRDASFLPTPPRAVDPAAMAAFIAFLLMGMDAPVGHAMPRTPKFG
jgi:hypothetical protein